jgi:hypothetical protein
MKFILISLLFCLPFASTFGQNMPFKAEEKAREKADLLTDRYQLDTEQAHKMYKIQLRKYKQINKLSLVKDQDPDFYIQKLEATVHGTDGSIRLLLDENQTRIYNNDQMKMRKKRAELVSELTKQGKAEMEVREASLLFQDRE